MSFLALVPISFILLPFFPIIIFFRFSLSTIIVAPMVIILLSSDSSSTIQVTECGISSSVRSNTFSLMNSDMINDGELLVTVVSSKYFILSGKYFFNTSISLSTLSFFLADTGIISVKLNNFCYSSIFFNISSRGNLSILFITKNTGLSSSKFFKISITKLSPLPIFSVISTTITTISTSLIVK